MSEPREETPRSHARLETGAVALLGLYYLARLLFFAGSIARGVPPDENTHVGLARVHAGAWLWPQDSPESHPLGLVSHVPYLYHALMGKLLWLNVVGAPDHLYLRAWNVLLAMATFLVAWRLARALLADGLARVLFLVLATNTLMLTFLSAAVSYDNLTNFLAAAALLAVLRHVQTGEPRHALAAALCLALGALTKTAFLPLGPILLVPWLVERRGRLRSDAARWLAELRAGRRGLAVGTAALALAAAAGVQLYGGNWLRFGTPTPGCERVLPLEACLENRIFARNWVLERYREGDFGFERAIQETRRIGHPGDRAYARQLLREERQYRQDRPEPLNRYDYVFLIWDRGIKPNVFGVMAHASLPRSPNGLLAYNLVLLVGGVLVIRGLRLRGPERHEAWLAFVVVAYFLFYMLFSYETYRTTHTAGLGVQGRYLFPVILPAYLLLARHLLRPFARPLKVGIALVVSGIFLAGDLPYFREHAGPRWYTDAFASNPSEPTAPRRADP